ncbi:MAG: low affinity iron permease family protein [Solirubrobacteraceae bacterium]
MSPDVKHPVDRGDEGRGFFDRVAESASNATSSPVFFAVCMLVIAAWAATYITGHHDTLQHVVGDTMAAITLFLLALIKNAELRSEHAIQVKLDAIAGALRAFADDDMDEGRRRLRKAEGLHDEV